MVDRGSNYLSHRFLLLLERSRMKMKRKSEPIVAVGTLRRCKIMKFRVGRNGTTRTLFSPPHQLDFDTPWSDR